MNKAEYNRKMKGYSEDIKRHIETIDATNEKLGAALTSRNMLSCEGWEE